MVTTNASILLVLVLVLVLLGGVSKGLFQVRVFVVRRMRGALVCMLAKNIYYGMVFVIAPYYLAYLTIAKSASSAQERFRKVLNGKIEDSIYIGLASKLDPADAEKAAIMRAKEIMSKLEALHEPDMVAGGWQNANQQIKRAGHADINSSIGASWNQGGRLLALDKAAEDARLAGKGGQKMNIQLVPCT